jgi:hypothetical protein
MLVVTANWSITDGTLVDPPARSWIAEFLSGIRRSAARAGIRRDGAYRPVDRVDVILAGDTFDWLVTAAWQGSERPWQRRARCGATRDRVMQATVKRGVRLLGKLARLARNGLTVAGADGRGRPVLGSQVRVPVRVVMLAGDRDAWLDEPRSAKLAERFGIAVGRSWADHPVAIVHGHAIDPLCGPAWGDAADRPPTLHESLSVDLVARFAVLVHETEPVAVARRVMGTLVASCPLDVPTRLRAWLDRADAVGSLAHDSRNRIESAWARAIDGWQRRARLDVPATEFQFDAVDSIANWLRASPVTMDAAIPAAAVAIPVATGGLSEDPALVVYGHLPTVSGATPGTAGFTSICLGRETVGRSAICGHLRGGVVSAVAMIAPEVEAFDTRPKTVTVFEPGEAGAADWSASFAGSQSAGESRPAAAHVPWIVDAA